MARPVPGAVGPGQFNVKGGPRGAANGDNDFPHRQGQAGAHCLETGLLPHPTGKEGGRECAWRRRLETQDFLWREEAPGYVAVRCARPKHLDIDPHLAPASEGIQHGLFGMRQVEVHRGPACIQPLVLGEVRLAARRACQGHRNGGTRKIVPEEGTQHASGRNAASAIPGAAAAVGSVALVVVQRFPQAVHFPTRTLERGHPHVGLAARQNRHGGGGAPVRTGVLRWRAFHSGGFTSAHSGRTSGLP